MEIKLISLVSSRRYLDFKIVWWWIVVILQLIGEGVLGRYLNTSLNEVRPILAEYNSLFFEFNVLYGVLVLSNFLIRKYWAIEDQSYYSHRSLPATIKFEWIPDVIGIVVGLIYLGVGLDLLLQVASSSP